ncbi:MAG: N-acetylneuraminate synthase family protein [Phycisphaerales bacterium]
MRTLAIILGRAGSKGVPGKNARLIGGRPCIAWTIDAALAARGAGAVSHVAVSTDSDELAAIARGMGVDVIDRPIALANDTARIDDAARHALEEVERRDGRFDAVVILYANVPVRPPGLIERAVARLGESGADSVQSYAPVGKHHPWWTAVVDTDSGKVRPWQGEVLNNGVFRRQDLPPAHMPDGGVLAVTRAALRLELAGAGDGPHAFFGRDRRGIMNPEGAVIDVDSAADLVAAEAALSVARATPQKPAGFRIAGREIGDNQPVYIIAEIGVNHDGDAARARELVDAAARAGADAVKFQFFRADLLMSASAKLAAYQKSAGETDALSMLRRLELGIDDLAAAGARAHELGLRAIVTVFSEPLVREAECFAWNAYKTASPDLVNTPLLAALRATNRPMIISTGAATMAEVRGTLAWLSVHGDGQVALLQCVSSYPCPDEHAALSGIGALRAVHAGPVGYSDHTSSLDTGALAVAAGASILEKHLTWSNRATGPDHAASLEPLAFAEYVRAARRAHTMLGSAGPRGKQLLEVEHEVRRVSRQSLTTARALRRGEAFSPENLCCKRPGDGVPAAEMSRIVGRRAARDLDADTTLRAEDIS